MKKPFIVFACILAFYFTACSSAEINRFIQGASQAALSNEDVADGLRDALMKGISVGADRAAKENGFFGNEMIKIPLPEELRNLESTLRRFGLGSEVDRVLLTINRGAENAAREAKPIFISAIRQLTIQDAFSILRGDQDAATQYLKRNTSEQLAELFEPEIQNSLDQVGATKHYSDLVNAYNAIPTTKKINPDLTAYVTEQAIEGLFKLVAIEEKKIRENPAERTTVIMKRVFASLD